LTDASAALEAAVSEARHRTAHPQKALSLNELDVCFVPRASSASLVSISLMEAAQTTQLTTWER
jgi:hypothetical protein